MCKDIEQMLIQEMQSEDHLDELLFDDSDGELIDAIMDTHTESIFSNNVESEEDEDE